MSDSEDSPGQSSSCAGSPSDTAEVRRPAVAGLFYPRDPAELEQILETLLEVPIGETPAGRIRALICPHAGYAYSGATAAQAYRLLEGHHFSTVYLLAPSHYASFQGASVCGASHYETPLGRTPISPLARVLAGRSPYHLERSCQVHRPAWSLQSSRSEVAATEETPHTWEHSDEVQVPFLQKVLDDFALVPVLFGPVDVGAAADSLAERLDDDSLVVVSSDLSHFHTYEEACELDRRCVQTVCDLDIEAMESQEACGQIPIRVLLHLAKRKGWTPHLVDYRNSGDTTGDRGRVVGYASIAFYGPAVASYSKADRQFLLSLAREAVSAAAKGGPSPEVDDSALAGTLGEPKACFVTLTKNGKLRGCIGHITPQQPLHRAILENARSAAIRDPRFEAVRPDELLDIHIEISILSEPRPLEFEGPQEILDQLQPGRDGVVLKAGGRTATFLPQVWDQIPKAESFMNQLACKAGLDAEQWRQPDVSVSTYQVVCFEEA